MRAGAGLALTVMTVLALACRETPSAASTEPPRIEIKAAVAPFDGTTISAPIEGRIAELLTSEGEVVRAGDAVATLINPAVERDLAHARAAVASAELRMRNRRSPSRPRVSNEGLHYATNLVRQREQKLARMRALLAAGDVAKQEVENAEAELAAAQRDLNAERQRMAAPQVAGDDAQLLEADLERARADLAFAEHRRGLLVVKAPVAGTIARLRVTRGSDVYTRDPIAEVVDSSMARVEARIAPELLRFVRAGKAVDVRLMTIPPRRFREPIARVVPPGSEGGSAIIVHVPNPDRMLQPGTPAVITIQ